MVERRERSVEIVALLGDLAAGIGGFAGGIHLVFADWDEAGIGGADAVYNKCYNNRGD